MFLQIVHCDNCDPNGDIFAEKATLFYGTEEESLELGWGIRDFGHICPKCIEEERYLEEVGDSGSVNTVDELFLKMFESSESTDG